MPPSRHPASRPRSARACAAWAFVLLAALGCAGGGAGGADAWNEDEWRTLHEARPEPRSGAAAVTISEVSLLGDPLGPSAALVGTELGLDELDRRPARSDPLDGVANAPESSGVPERALVHFLRGLDAEESWRWEEARRDYQEALAVDPDFYEARVALRRTARLRLGGTLGES